MDSIILKVKNLVKKYRNFTAVNSISFSIRKGEVVGLLGPNGAGKTTTIQMLLGITLPTSGGISYFGKDFYKHREYCLQRINFSSAETHLQNRITVWENLKVYAGLYKVQGPAKKIAKLAEKFEIGNLLAQRYWSLSSGQKTRVSLVKALLNEPRLILMDEPTASLDPDIRDKFLSLIERSRKELDISILYTSHDMDEVTRICDRVIFLDHGKIVAMDTPLGLTRRVQESRMTITFEGDSAGVKQYLEGKGSSYNFIRSSVVEIQLAEEQIPGTLFGIKNAGVWITDIDLKKPDLEDFFLSFTRRNKNVLSKN